VVRGRSDTDELSLPIGDVKPVKFILQYLTQAAAVKLPSAGDDTCSDVQHMLLLGSIAMSLSVCLSVCLSARVSQKPHIRTQSNFMCVLPVAAARFYVLCFCG